MAAALDPRGVTLDRLSPTARSMLDAVSSRVSLPSIVVTSTHRTEAQNARAGGAKNSMHLGGHALDLDVSGLGDDQKRELLEAAVAAGARGVGIYASGKTIHLDVRDTPAFWGADPSAPYAGSKPEQAPRWAQDTLARLFQSGGGAIAPPPARGAIQAQINEAAARFGVDPAYLQSTAQRESSFRPNARNPNSSATGLFGFTAATWKSVSDRYGRPMGMPEGTSPTDPKWSALMAAALTKEHQIVMRQMIGRDANPGELYLAHFLGGPKAVEMIKAVDTQGDAAAAVMFPAAAVANPEIFYQNGQPRSVAEVYKDLTTLKPADVESPPPPATMEAKAPGEDSGPSSPGSWSPIAAVGPVVQRSTGQAAPQVESEIDAYARRVGVARQPKGLLG